MMRHMKWVAESGINSSDRALHEHEVLSDILERMTTIDQLNVTNLVGTELAVRRIQLIEEAHRGNPGQPSYEGAEYWMGTRRRRAGVLINPVLSKHVAEEVRAERRKAKEEKAAAKAAPKK